MVVSGFVNQDWFKCHALLKVQDGSLLSASFTEKQDEVNVHFIEALRLFLKNTCLI